LPKRRIDEIDYYLIGIFEYMQIGLEWKDSWYIYNIINALSL